jgi:hypothetical protein
MDNQAVVPSAEKAVPQITRRKSPDFRVIYSNEFRYRVTPNDIGLVFSNMADIGEGDKTIVMTEEVLIQMSLGQAKALAEYLTMIVARFERTIGPVRALGKAAPNEAELDTMFKILENIGLH